jgi:ATP phosphoribosyltransferase
MIKFYIPDGHLERKTVELLERAGFRIEMDERGYTPRIDDPEIKLKRIRPQDFPFVISLGKGDIGITGEDIVEEFRYEYPQQSEKIVKLLPLGYGNTKLVAAISQDVFPGIKTMDGFRKKVGKRKVVVATEYPNISREYLRRKKIDAIIRKPYGKTEGWILPPDPEADLIIDTVETGRTLLENNCRSIGTIMESSAVLIGNRESINKRKVGEIVELLKGAISAKDKVNVWMNVLKPEDLRRVIRVVESYVKHPTVSQLSGGGYDVFVILEKEKLKYILPKLKKSGASDIVVSDTRMLL